MRRSLVGTLLVFAVSLAAADPPRIVAIGDIHGSLDGLVTILGRAGLIDAARHWSGGDATLVQTGDYTDRGTDVRAVMDLLMALENEAKAARGQVVTLVGNHELMNLIGETRDATTEILATFADAGSESRREAAWRDYEALSKRRLVDRPDAPDVYRQTREAWMTAHPPGYLEYRAAFGPRGHYGRWLRGKAAIARLGATAFIHAGVDPEVSDATPDAVNEQVRDEVRRYDAYLRTLVDGKLALPFFSLQEVVDVTVWELKTATAYLEASKAGTSAPPPLLDGRGLREAVAVTEIGTWALLAPGGPMWFRGYATWPDTSEPLLTSLLARWQVERIVSGHTPQPSGITARFDNRLFLIDTGMLVRVYKGRPSALEIVGTRVKAIYPDGETVLTPLGKNEILGL
ncbi:MAG: metallophosphoesterase [Acidobacteria bacterium]|nr:metallophosphoesterase [Acidobacteriota bacterium]